MSSLTILGASARAAAFSATRAGFEPYSIDCFADSDLAELCRVVRIERYPHDFPTALAAAPNGPWMYTGGLENYPRLVDRLARIRPILGNSGDVLRRVRDPWGLAAALHEAGIASPRLARSATGGEWLVKPLRGSAGLGVRRAAGRDLSKPPRGTVLQEFAEGESASAVYVGAGGQAVFLGATRQLLGRDFGLAREFLYAGSVGPLVLTGDEQTKLERIGMVLAEQFGLRGLFGVDFIRSQSEIWPIEVNPRYTASVEVLERLIGQHFVALHLAACKRNQLPAPRPLAWPQSCFGKAVVYAQGASQWDTISVPFSLADVPQVGQRLAAGHPVVTVFAEAQSPAEVEAALRQHVQAIHTMLTPL
jgi:predicted ATP-grasp superfamily ATP-dependent carboligase